MNENIGKFGKYATSFRRTLKIRLIANLLMLSVLLVFVSSCTHKKSSRSSTPEEPSTSKTLRSSTSDEPSTSKTAAPQSSGEFKVVYEPVKKPAHRAIQQAFQQSQGFEKVAQSLNKTIALPRNVQIVLGDCGVENAYYQPSKHRLVMCYELIDYFAKVFQGKFKTKAELSQAVGGATVFTFFHELGHALIGELKLPITGRQEDVADEFSTLLLSKGGDTAGKAPLAAATWFALEGTKPKHEKFWDEHSLDQQRFYGIVCLLYGRDSSRYAALAKNVGLPDVRLKKCRAEYVQKSKAWKALLAPHLKKQEQL